MLSDLRLRPLCVAPSEYALRWSCGCGRTHLLYEDFSTLTLCSVGGVTVFLSQCLCGAVFRAARTHTEFAG